MSTITMMPVVAEKMWIKNDIYCTTHCRVIVRSFMDLEYAHRWVYFYLDAPFTYGTDLGDWMKKVPVGKTIRVELKNKARRERPYYQLYGEGVAQLTQGRDYGMYWRLFCNTQRELDRYYKLMKKLPDLAIPYDDFPF